MKILIQGGVVHVYDLEVGDMIEVMFLIVGTVPAGSDPTINVPTKKPILLSLFQIVFTKLSKLP